MKTRSIRFLLAVAILVLLFLPACDVIVSTETVAPPKGFEATVTALVADRTPQPTALETPRPTPTGLLEEIIVERTPIPTPTPGRIQQEINKAVALAGLSRTKVLGLKITDWASLGVALFYILVGYLIGTWVVIRVFRNFARHTSAGLSQVLQENIGPDMRWLVVLLAAYFATRQLTFLSAETKTLLGDGYFVLGLFFILRVVWRLITLAEEWYRQRAVEEGRVEELGPIMVLSVRSGRVITVITGVTVLLSHFGVNVTAFATALGLGGLAISLAARDTIADAIAGFIILVDRPFRIGDRIEIQSVGTWGDVVEIGLRTTRIRTRDNRMVILPNSIISSNQVINYSYPDPRYRIETHVGVAYGTDIEKVRKLIVDSVSGLEFVLQEKPVDALYVEMGDSAMIFRVRWWIESYVDTRRAVDRVHTALQQVLDANGIECPYPTQSLNLQVDAETARRFSQVLKESVSAQRKPDSEGAQEDNVEQDG